MRISNTDSKVLSSGKNWVVCPFDDLEKLFSQNKSNKVIRTDTVTPEIDLNQKSREHEDRLIIKERDLQARKIIAHPQRFYKGTRKNGLMSKDRRKHKNNERYGVMSLAEHVNVLSGLRVKALAFCGDAIEIPCTGWADALSGVMCYLAENMPGTIEQIDKEGLLGWVDKNDPSIDMQRSWRQGNCHVRLGENKDACFLIQWLFLMCGIPLNEVDFYYDRYTDENWRIHQQKIRHQQEIQKLLEVSRKKTKPKSKIDYPFFTLRHSHGNKKKQPSNSISRRCCKVHSIPASDRVYMVMDGVVVFCSPRTTIDSSKEVMRVDTPEEWNGS